MTGAALSPAGASGLLGAASPAATGGAAAPASDRLGRGRRRALAAAMGLAALALAAIVWLARSPSAARGAGGGARLVTAELRTVETRVTATGIIRPRVGGEVRVGSQVSGVVKSLRVTEGSHIRRGEVIAVIDSRAIEARLAQARAQAAVDAVEVRRARFELARGQRLAALELVPRQQAADLGLAAESAQAKLDKSLRDVAVVETDLVNVVLRAPIAGTVASVSTQQGETVAAAFAAPTFVTILADDALQLVAMVDETDIGNVRAGNPVRFTTEAFPARELAGRVARVAPKATIVSGVVNYEVTVEILEGARDLKPDMTANVSIQTARHAALMLPAAAVGGREGGDLFVLAEQSGRLVRRAVTAGARDAGLTEIKSGLRAGERVAAEAAPAPPAPAGEDGDAPPAGGAGAAPRGAPAAARSDR
jgi:RND family efflux transporter MFP subunit